MTYTAFTESEFESLPKKYRGEAVGIRDCGEIMQPPLCPECWEPCMEQEGYLSCTECGAIRKLRVLSDV